MGGTSTGLSIKYVTRTVSHLVNARMNRKSTFQRSKLWTVCLLYPRLIAGTNLPTPKGWIAWWARADCKHITVCPRLLHNWIQRHREEMNPDCRVQDQLNTSEPTAPYIKVQEINIWTCWAIGKSNPGPFARAASGLTTGPPRPLKVCVQQSKLCLQQSKLCLQ